MFFRTQYSCLVNPAKIKIYDRKADSSIWILEKRHTIPISQIKKEMVLQLLENKT
jgi:DNA-binding LytR/AlgR family response regulator